MISVAEHLAPRPRRRPAAVAARARPAWTPTAACSPRTSSRPAPLPGFDNSAVDGYAVRLADVADGDRGTTPVVLPVTGDVAAGPASPLRVSAGSCVRIMTGAMVPAGADSVIPLEWTDGGVATVVDPPGADGRRQRPPGRGGRRRGRHGADRRHPPRRRADRAGRRGRPLAAARAPAPARRRRLDRQRARRGRPAARPGPDRRRQQPGADRGRGRGRRHRLPRRHRARRPARARRDARGPARARRRPRHLRRRVASGPTTSSRRCCPASAPCRSTRSPCSPGCRRASAPSAPTRRRCSGCPATRSARW